MRNVYCASLLILFLMSGLSVKALQAQDRPSLVLQGSMGAREDIIESVCGGGQQNSYGGSLHYYVTRRTSVGTEVLGFNHCTQNFTYYAPKMSVMVKFTHDFSDGRVRPFVNGGVGFINHDSQYAPPQTKLDAAAGGGVKIFATKRIFVVPEVMFAADVTFRYSLGVGFVLR